MKQLTGYDSEIGMAAQRFSPTNTCLERSAIYINFYQSAEEKTACSAIVMIENVGKTLCRVLQGLRKYIILQKGEET